MQILSFPQRLNADGSFGSVEQLSDAGSAEAIGAFIFTHQGERPLALGYGTHDLAFGWFEPGEITAGISVYNPEITISDVTLETTAGAITQILIGFND